MKLYKFQATLLVYTEDEDTAMGLAQLVDNSDKYPTYVDVDTIQEITSVEELQSENLHHCIALKDIDKDGNILMTCAEAWELLENKDTSDAEKIQKLEERIRELERKISGTIR